MKYWKPHLLTTPTFQSVLLTSLFMMVTTFLLADSSLKVASLSCSRVVRGRLKPHPDPLPPGPCPPDNTFLEALELDLRAIIADRPCPPTPREGLLDLAMSVVVVAPFFQPEGLRAGPRDTYAYYIKQ